MSQFEVVDTGEVVRIGRHDVTGAPSVRLVTIDGNHFAESPDGQYAEQCGYCSPAWSGSVTHYAHIAEGVCFRCRGTGRYGAWRSHDEVVRLVKGRDARARKAERDRIAREQAMAAKAADWAKANPEVAAMLAEVAADLPDWATPEDVMYRMTTEAEDVWGRFLVELAVAAPSRGLTAGQTDAVAPAFERAKAQRAAKAAKVEESRWWGAEGDKVAAATGVVAVWTTYQTNYSYTPQTNALIVVEGTGDYAGVTFKIMGTGKTLWDCGRGDVVEVTGTVKAHGEYEGVKQTQLTRAKVVVTEAAEKEDQ